jgi:SsrA-binding protein
MPDLVRNKKAFHDYQVLEKFEAGIALVGTEVKSCRASNASLDEAYVRPEGAELFLVDAHIAPYEQGGRDNHEPRRPRRLLMHRNEIRRLLQNVNAKGLTLVPLRLYLVHGLVKLQVGLCRGKQKADKRQDMRKKQSDRELRNLTR